MRMLLKEYIRCLLSELEKREPIPGMMEPGEPPSGLPEPPGAFSPEHYYEPRKGSEPPAPETFPEEAIPYLGHWTDIHIAQKFNLPYNYVAAERVRRKIKHPWYHWKDFLGTLDYRQRAERMKRLEKEKVKK